MGVENSSEKGEVRIDGLLFGPLNTRLIGLLRAFQQADGPQKVADLVNRKEIEGTNAGASKNKNRLIKLGLLKPTEYRLEVSVPARFAQKVAVTITSVLFEGGDSKAGLINPDQNVNVDLTELMMDPEWPKVLELIQQADAEARKVSCANSKIKYYEIPTEINPLLEALFEAETEIESMLDNASELVTGFISSLNATCLCILEEVTLGMDSENFKKASRSTLSQARATLKQLGLITTKKQGRKVFLELSKKELKKPLQDFLEAMREIERLLSKNANTEA